MAHLIRAGFIYLAIHFYQIWAVVGPFIGILIGSWLASRWQRLHWIRESKKAEYRVIFDALNKFHWLTTDFVAFYDESPFADTKAEGRKFDQQHAVMDSLSALMGTFAAALFARSAILRSGVIHDLQAFYHSFESDKKPDFVSLARTVSRIHVRILRIAWDDLGVPGRFKFEPPEVYERYAKPTAPAQPPSSNTVT